MLSIAILHYNHTNLTNECLGSVLSQEISFPHEILVIDNGSEIPFTHPNERIRIYKLPLNVGNIAGQNMAFLLSNYEWVLFVSNDVKFEKDAIKTLWNERFQGQLMPIVLNPDLSHQSFGGRLVWPGYGFNIMKRRVCKDYALDYVPSICYLMPKDLWRKIGGFDEKYPMAYEDVDLGLRLGGSRLKCSHSAFAIHLGNATLGFQNNKRFVEGRKRFINKHYKGVNRIVRLLTMKTLAYIPNKSTKVIT